MIRDPQTIAYYDEAAKDYGDNYARSEPDGDLLAFLAALPSGGEPILDWACGVGNTAAILTALGYKVRASDASTGMAEVALELGVAVRLESFEALAPEPVFRGIWANFSLLHCPRAQLADMLSLAEAALVPGGVLHLGMETGSGEFREPNGMRISLWRDEEIDRLVQGMGFEPISLRHGRGKKLSGDELTFFIHLSRKPDGT